MIGSSGESSSFSANELAGVSDGQSHWYLIQMKSNQHYKGLNNLLGRGYQCYSPEITIKKIKKGKKINVTEPLFPSYVFIKLNRDCNWQSVSSTRGVAKFIRFGSYPTIVPDKTIESISGNLDRTEEYVLQKNMLKPGERVIIDYEEFKDFEAVFKCETSSNRSIILLNYIEKVQEVSIKNEKLKLVKAR